MKRPQHLTYFLIDLMYPIALSATIAIPAGAKPLDRFPLTSSTSAPTLLCHITTAQGQSFDLTRICGQNSPIATPSPNRPASQTSIAPSNSANPPAKNTNLILPNPNVPPTLGANPGNPFSSSANRGKCYIVDSDGRSCPP